jgi:hypothetical protein
MIDELNKGKSLPEGKTHGMVLQNMKAKPTTTMIIYIKK